jgi:hypothetical protein
MQVRHVAVAGDMGCVCALAWSVHLHIPASQAPMHPQGSWLGPGGVEEREPLLYNQ